MKTGGERSVVCSRCVLEALLSKGGKQASCVLDVGGELPHGAGSASAPCLLTLGELDGPGWLGIQQAAQPEQRPEASLFQQEAHAERVEVNMLGVRIGCSRPFGALGWG